MFDSYLYIITQPEDGCYLCDGSAMDMYRLKQGKCISEEWKTMYILVRANE
jgi:hypothetical protein